jgi:hypothetical protein
VSLERSKEGERTLQPIEIWPMKIVKSEHHRNDAFRAQPRQSAGEVSVAAEERDRIGSDRIPQIADDGPDEDVAAPLWNPQRFADVTQRSRKLVSCVGVSQLSSLKASTLVEDSSDLGSFNDGYL